MNDIPKEWHHDPNIADGDGDTVAILMAKWGGVIPPEEWRHDPLKANKKGVTVAIGLAKNGIVPPKYWMHNIDIKTK